MGRRSHTSLKTLEESARLSHRLAENEATRGHAWLMKRFRDREIEARNRAEVIRRFLRDETGESAEAGEDSTQSEAQ